MLNQRLITNADQPSGARMRRAPKSTARAAAAVKEAKMLPSAASADPPVNQSSNRAANPGHFPVPSPRPTAFEPRAPRDFAELYPSSRAPARLGWLRAF